jgi:hypothetical protein
MRAVTGQILAGVIFTKLLPPSNVTPAANIRSTI